MENQTLEQVANNLFDEMGFSEGDELSFSKDEYLTGNEEATSKGLGEQDNNTEEAKPEVKAETPRLYAGRFQTVEEMEKAFVESQAVKEDKIEAKHDDSLPDLTREELIALHEQSEMDGKNFIQEYLQKKMQERDLSDFEVEKLKELGTDNYAEYVAVKTKRETMAELNPILKPVVEEQQKKQYDEYVEREKAIFTSIDTEYEKTELATIKQKTTDPKFIDEVLRQSDLGSVIQNEFQNGSKATAYKLLVRETKIYLDKQSRQTEDKKRQRSFPADVGSKAEIKKNRSGSIEEAFNDSLEEFNF